MTPRIFTAGRTLVLAALLLGASDPVASAQARLCVPQAGGVPYNPNPPSWSATNDASVLPDDARWRGALGLGEQRSLGSSLGSGGLRLLQRIEGGTRQLYLAFAVSDPTGTSFATTTRDQIEVALANLDGTKRYRLRVGVDTSATMSDAPSPARVTVALDAFNPALGAFIPVPTPTSWAAAVAAADVGPTGGGSAGKVRAYVECPNASSNCAFGTRWAVLARIPIGAATDADLSVGLPIGDEFFLWYRAVAVYDSAELGTTISSVFVWPSVATPPAEPPTDTASWEKLRIDGTGACVTGITLASDDVSTDSSASPRLITANPTFHARPTNAMSPGIAGGAITASFRIADWGSAPATSAAWRLLCSGTGNDALIVPGTSSGSGPGRFDLSCSAVVNLCEYQLGTGAPPCDAGPGASVDAGIPKYLPHQCVLTELAVSPTGGGQPLVFTPVSTFTNMDVEAASTVERDAVISVDGLGAIPGEPGRTVYLYVETRNMPRIADLNGKSPPAADWPPELRRQVQTGRVSEDAVASRMPTYLVHVLHEGRDRANDGSEHEVYLAQPSFGLFVSHDGAFVGWKHAIHGASVTRIHDFLYRLDVPDGGRQVVRLEITACEDGSCDAAGPTEPIGRCPHGTFVCFLLRFWWLWLIALAVLIGGALHGTRSRTE